jgi:streptomycin 6-kinase
MSALDAAVTAALRAKYGDAVAVAGLRTLQGGRSGVTLTAEVTGIAGHDAVVVKAAPDGRPPTGRHDVLRQGRVIEHVHALPGFVVPEILATGTQPVHFVVMQRSAGESVEPVLDAAEIHLSADLVTRRAFIAAEMLAALHAALDTPRLADGACEPPADLGSEVSRWRQVGEAADPEILRDGARLAALLDKLQPRTPVEPVLVHGDYRLGNIVFDGPTPTGVIDWEIWGRTHPGVDIGWFLVFCDPDLFPGIGEPVAGMPSSLELLGRYRAAGGSDVEELAWFEAFGRFKMAAIMAHNLRRHREGRHHDPFQERLPPTINALVQTGIDKLDSGA